MKQIALMLLLGQLSPSKTIRTNSNFIDIDDDKFETKGWNEVSKEVRRGSELDMFTDDYKRSDPTNVGGSN